MFGSSVIADFARNSEDEDRWENKEKEDEEIQELAMCHEKEAEGVSNRMTMTIPLFVRFDIVKKVYGDLLDKKAIGKELNSLIMMENSLNDYQLLTFSWDGLRP